MKRLVRGFGLREMARSTNISPSFLSDIELDRTAPSLDTLRTIVSFLECSDNEKAEILSGKYVNPQSPPPDASIPATGANPEASPERKPAA
jgi:transcriptional regulator with XRE-family HTH domain